MTHSCDFTRSPIKGEHDADISAEVRIEGTSLSMDLCEADRELLMGALMELGFVPTKMQVGKNRRGAYVAHSGRTFTTKDARVWLLDGGHVVAESGRLTAEQLKLYAQAH